MRVGGGNQGGSGRCIRAGGGNQGASGRCIRAGCRTRLSVGGVPDLEVDTRLPVVKEMLTVSSPSDTVDKLPGVVVSSSVPSEVS